MKKLEQIKTEIITALSHNEAEEGLYFRNFYHLHEEDERPPVQAPEEEILDALKELISEGRVKMTDDHGEMVFALIGG